MLPSLDLPAVSKLGLTPRVRALCGRYFTGWAGWGAPGCMTISCTTYSWPEISSLLTSKPCPHIVICSAQQGICAYKMGCLEGMKASHVYYPSKLKWKHHSQLLPSLYCRYVAAAINMWNWGDRSALVPPQCAKLQSGELGAPCSHGTSHA